MVCKRVKQNRRKLRFLMIVKIPISCEKRNDSHYILCFECHFGQEMVGATGIEPVTPTMST